MNALLPPPSSPSPSGPPAAPAIATVYRLHLVLLMQCPGIEWSGGPPGIICLCASQQPSVAILGAVLARKRRQVPLSR